jgi:peptidoglycan/xylan/chitin deacetylase (PgdA/CDA1 family)
MTSAATRRRVATRVLGVSPVARAVRAIARGRGHGLALVYHRVADLDDGASEIVPTVTPEVFRRQVAALAEVAAVVGLGAIGPGDDAAEARPGGFRPKVALTFDDDLVTHVSEAVPVLERAGLVATFFLSGRALVGEGAYWFQQLEALVDAYGTARVADELGSPGLGAGALAEAAERDRAVRDRVSLLAPDVDEPPILDPAGITALRDAGMDIGFHTVEHVPLPSLHDEELARALHRGRSELGSVLGRPVDRPVDRFAYPHGTVDARSRAAVRRAAFSTAWTGSPTVVRRTDDAFALGRWEPGPLAVDDFLIKLAVRLHRRSRPVGGGSR